MKSQKRTFSNYYYDRMNAQRRNGFEEELRQDPDLLEAYNSFRIFTNATLATERQLMLEEARTLKIDDETLLLYYTKGMLPVGDDLIRQIEIRIAADPAYANRIDRLRQSATELDEMSSAVNQVTPPLPHLDTAKVRRLPLNRWLSVAAAVALLVTSVWWMIGPSGLSPDLREAYNASVVVDESTSDVFDKAFKTALSEEKDIRASKEYKLAVAAFNTNNRDSLYVLLERMRTIHPEAWKKDVSLQAAHLRLLQEAAPENEAYRDLALELYPDYLMAFKNSSFNYGKAREEREVITVGYKVAMLKALDTNRLDEAKRDLEQLLKENKSISAPLRAKIQAAADLLQ